MQRRHRASSATPCRGRPACCWLNTWPGGAPRAGTRREPWSWHSTATSGPRKPSASWQRTYRSQRSTPCCRTRRSQ
eukprot:8300411-Lingulodinium_polyedra.AAC.1